MAGVTVEFTLPSALFSVRVHVRFRVPGSMFRRSGHTMSGVELLTLNVRTSNSNTEPEHRTQHRSTNANSEAGTRKCERLYYRSVFCLSLDTTTPGGSRAVARDGVVIHEFRGDPDRPHDARLPGDLMALLADTRLGLRDIELYAVATGPGSFTGLRIGIATMQGLAFAGGKPLIGVSGFEALARTVIDGRALSDSSTAQSGPAVATWVDAWRGEVFAARYEGDVEVEPPSVEKPEAVLARIAAPTLFVGDAVPIYGDVIVRVCGDRALFAEPPAPPLAGTIAQLATAQARTGHRPAPDDIRPLYIRRPDAERARDARPVR
jgi:tRNA threonylcarbamoyladenosine biosynthesis protein TsaB